MMISMFGDKELLLYFNYCWAMINIMEVNSPKIYNDSGDLVVPGSVLSCGSTNANKSAQIQAPVFLHWYCVGQLPVDQQGDRRALATMCIIKLCDLCK